MLDSCAIHGFLNDRCRPRLSGRASVEARLEPVVAGRSSPSAGETEAVLEVDTRRASARRWSNTDHVIVGGRQRKGIG